MGGRVEQERVITGMNPCVITTFGYPYVKMDVPLTYSGTVVPHVFVPAEMFTDADLGRIESGQVAAVSLDKPNDRSPWTIANVRMRPEPASSEVQPVT